MLKFIDKFIKCTYFLNLRSEIKSYLTEKAITCQISSVVLLF